MPQFQAALVESLTRRQYWLIIAVIMLALVGLCVWAGFYQIDVVDDGNPKGETIEPANPLEAFAYTRLGNVVILALLQFTAANVMLWSLIWIARRIPSKQRG